MSAAQNPYVTFGWEDLDPHLQEMILGYANRRFWFEDYRLARQLPNVWDNLADFEVFKEALEDFEDNDDEERDSRVRMVRKYEFEREQDILGPVTVRFSEKVNRHYYEGWADMSPICAALDRNFTWSGISKIRLTEHEDEDYDKYLIFQLFRRRQDGQEEKVHMPADFQSIHFLFPNNLRLTTGGDFRDF